MKTIRKLPSFKDLRVQFYYEESTGHLYTRDKNYKPSRRVGGIVKEENTSYVIVSVKYPNRKAVGSFAHRVIWKLMTGKEPPTEIDHVDGNGLNNRWNNLRDGTGGVNARNRVMYKTNTTGFNGVYQKRGKWIARNGEGKGVGVFVKAEEAALRAKEVRLKAGFTDRHGMPKT